MRPALAVRLLLSLDAKSMLRVVRRQGWALLLLCFYVFIEYFRPQQRYTSLGVLPWGLLSLAGAAIAALVAGGKRRLHELDVPLLLFGLWVFISGILAFSPEESLKEWKTAVNWAMLYLLVTSLAARATQWLVFLVVYAAINYRMALGGVSQWAQNGFGFTTWGVYGSPGWFHNSGEFGLQMDVFAPVALAIAVAVHGRAPRWKALAALGGLAASLISIMVSSSRGAQLAMVVSAIYLVAQTRYLVRGLIGLAAAMLIAYAVLPEEQINRFRESGKDETSTMRMTYWRHGIKIAKEHPLTGVGYGNWVAYYRRYYNPKGELPHNIFVQAAAELGYPGLVLLVWLILHSLKVNWQTARRSQRGPPDGRWIKWMAHGLNGATIGYVVAGSFVTVLYYPYLWMNLAMTASLSTAQRQTTDGQW